MSELYAFLFCLGLGIAARIIYMASTLLARRTDLLPVTVVLDMLVCIVVGGAFTVYVIFTGAVLAPYMFAALASGYLLAYLVTRESREPKKKRREKIDGDGAGRAE